MQNNTMTEEKIMFMEKWKKKLFIASAYLAVSFALLILVSYGQYKIKVEGEAIMPAAAEIEACLDLEKNLSETVNLNAYLTDLQPGDSARTYASASATDPAALNHKLQVKITNSYVVASDTTLTTDLDLDYTLRIGSSGHIPMQFIMIDGSKKYISKPEAGRKEYRFYEVTGSGNNETISATEAKFTLLATNSTGNTYQIFAGWDNTPDNATSLTDASYRKELELLELRADVIAKTTHYTTPAEAELQNRISTQSRVATTTSIP